MSPVGRPREHDQDALLDHARRLWVERGRRGVTIRALSESSGASNGVLYNAFHSRDGLLTRVWCREAVRFLAFQTAVVDRAWEEGEPTDAVLTAALAPADYSVIDEDSARLLLTARSDTLADADLASKQRDELKQLRRELSALIVELSSRLWGRTDTTAVTLVKYCVVDLPSALLLADSRLTDPLARLALVRAVEGVIATPPPPPEQRRKAAPQTSAGHPG